MYSNEISFALMGTMGIITLSLFVTQIVKYFVGTGMSCVLFLLVCSLTGNANISMFLAVGMGIFLCNSFDWIVENDMYSAILLVVISVIGFVMATVFLSELWNYYGISSSGLFRNIEFFKLYNRIANYYKELLHVLK